MATITTSDELRLVNRSRILSCLRNHEKQSRTVISELTGLSNATVTQITAGLIDEEVIERIEAAEGQEATGVLTTRRGRPQVQLDLRNDAATTAIITLLLNHLEISLYDYRGKLLYQQKKRILTAKLTSKTLPGHFNRLLDKALDKQTQWKKTLKHIAVVYQGTVSGDNKRLLWSPITAVRDFDLAPMLEQRYCASVSVLNDCKVIASALYRNRAPEEDNQGNRNFAAILLSYGIGLGLFHNGAILTGSNSSGTEFGHMLLQANGARCRCGRYGCIEAYASDYGIWRYANSLHEHTLPEDEVSSEDFVALVKTAKENPGPARQAFEKAGAALGLGLTNLFALFDPFPVLLIGTSRDAFALMKPALYENLQHFGADTVEDLINVYDKQSEGSLIMQGASRLALENIDHMFSFGENKRDANRVHSA